MGVLMDRKRFEAIEASLKEREYNARRLKGEVDELQRQKEVADERVLRTNEALTFVQQIAKATTSNLEDHLSSIGTLALGIVFDEPMEFIARVETRRDQIEVDMLIREDGEEVSPKKTAGGGAVDIIDYAEQVAFWALYPNRPVFLLDEPFKYVSPDLQEKVSEMVKTIANELELQHIIISHAEDVNMAADRTFTMKKVNGVTVTEVS